MVSSNFWTFQIFLPEAAASKLWKEEGNQDFLSVRLSRDCKKNTGMYLSFGNHIVHKPLYWNNFGQDCLNLFVSSSCTSMYKNMRHSESNKADTWLMGFVNWNAKSDNAHGSKIEKATPYVGVCMLRPSPYSTTYSPALAPASEYL